MPANDHKKKHRQIAPGTTVLVASHNTGKILEINDLLEPFGVTAVSAGALNLPEPEETGTSFAANALLKAELAAQRSGMIALSDDSGLCIDALDGEPGIYSARWAGPDKDFSLAMRNAEEKLRAVNATTPPQRQAHFVCALCLAWPDGHHQIYQGKVFGHLTWPPRGNNGFGYDPIFVPDNHDITFGEMEPTAKHAMSHRAIAFKHLIDAAFVNEH